MLADYQRVMLRRHQDNVYPVARPAAAGHAETDGTDHDIALAIWRAQTILADELVSRIYAREPAFFEHLVIDVQLAMGYGKRRRDLARRLGRSSDGGVDGIISMDELGLDLVYLQAKRLKPGSAVPVSEVRDLPAASTRIAPTRASSWQPAISRRRRRISASRSRAASFWWMGKNSPS